ncbi:MAG TPA: NAD(P)H-binding protein [Terriglobales bacterium]|nr:NAD(P)H-binding protein [Terriglobales bacterium]
MKIAITGASGFVGSHLAQALLAREHDVVAVARGFRKNELELNSPRLTWCASDLSDAGQLAQAFKGCDAVAHCAGINREIGDQTYTKVHIRGTKNVVDAAHTAGVPKIAMLSFLRARPNCGSAYHESKWAAEEMLRTSGLNYTVIKAGMIYGLGDHMLDHLTKSLNTLPIFATVGLRERPIRPLAIADLVRLLCAALAEGSMSRSTVAVMGPEELRLSEAARRVARLLGRRVYVFPAPVWFHRIFARVLELAMKVPLVAAAQVRILEEGVVAPEPPAPAPPPELAPRLYFTDEQIRRGLPHRLKFGLADLRCCAS